MKQDRLSHNSIPNELVPLRDICRKEAWKLLMMEFKMLDLLSCPINEAALRNFTDIATVPSSVKKSANVFFYTVTGALTNPYTIIHRFFVAGDYGRKTAVGEFSDLRLVAYVSESPPYDIAPSTSHGALDQNIHDVLCEHFTHLKRAGNWSENFDVTLKPLGDVLVYTSKGQKMTIRLAPACSNPCVKANDDAGGGFDDVRAVLHNMLRDDWVKPSQEKDRYTYCYFEEVACRVLSSFPDQWVRFIKLCKYICMVHTIGLESDLIETIAIRVLISSATRNTWPHTTSSTKVVFEWCLYKFLEAVLDVDLLNSFDLEEYPKNLCFFVHKTDKISLKNDELDEIITNLSEIHQNEAKKFHQKRSTNQLKLSIRPLFRPFHNLGDSIQQFDQVQRKCLHLLNVLKSDQMDISLKNLFEEIPLEEEVRSAKERAEVVTTGRSDVLFLRFLIRAIICSFKVLLFFVFIAFIAASLFLIAIMEPDGSIDAMRYEMKVQMLQHKLLVFQNELIFGSQFVNLLFKHQWVGLVEDKVEELVILSRQLPYVINNYLNHHYRDGLLQTRFYMLSLKELIN